MVGELLKFTSWTKIIYKYVSKSPVVSVLSASAIGILSPLCTYGTIPVVIELYKSKVHIAPLMAFLAASSLMNPQLFIMTAGGINLEMALVRTFAVFIFSFAVGMLCYLLPEKFMVRKDVQFYDNGGESILNRGKKLFLVKQYCINCLQNLRHLGLYLVIGIFISAIIELYVPKTLIAAAFRSVPGQPILGRIKSILAGALLGIPLSPCGGSAIPIVGGMMDNGMGRGTALAFFIVGPATRPAPLIAMATLFTPLFLAAYCLFLIVSAVLMGLGYV
ncbi:permease [Spirochaetia bacterium]|nr:permease [Spirochaetia bacterium]